MAVESAFDLLHPDVQRQLWRMKWQQLRPLQVDSIRQILTTEANVILSAATAAGKTEAAFLPILSKIAFEPTGSVRAVYVGPLKALINDQFSRVEELCSYLEMPVHTWHGDVPAAAKKRLIKAPAGILLITPESLESLFVNRPNALGSLFAGLRFVVIDELHSFLSNERGVQLRSLLYRLARELKEARFRCVGLSATLGDLSPAREYLALEDTDRVLVIEDRQAEKAVQFEIRAYWVPFDLATSWIDEEARTPGKRMEPTPDVWAISADIIRDFNGHSGLIFANTKADVEVFADSCKQSSTSNPDADLFLVHHGSLSAEIREDAELTMKSGKPAITFCSSTLEMGVDIGSVWMVGHIGTPWSVASLAQRLGRSGRKIDDPRRGRIYLTCEEPKPASGIFDRLFLELVRAISLFELMRENWVEPARATRCDLSTLTQQIISMISQYGSRRAEDLHRSLCQQGAFRDVEPSLFAKLLRQLAKKDVIEQIPGGDLILGLLGERIRKDKGFYAVFATPRELAVIHDGQNLGRLVGSFTKDQNILFAGRRWRIEAVDEEHMRLYVVPSKGHRRPQFSSGGYEIHPVIRARTRRVLGGNEQYAYIDTTAKRLLEDARSVFVKARLHVDSLVATGPRHTAIATWTGTRIHETIRLMLLHAGIASEDQEVALVLKVNISEARTLVERCLSAKHDPMILAGLSRDHPSGKYDYLLSDELAQTAVARDWLDIPGALRVLGEIKSAAPTRPQE